MPGAIRLVVKASVWWSAWRLGFDPRPCQTKDVKIRRYLSCSSCDLYRPNADEHHSATVQWHAFEHQILGGAGRHRPQPRLINRYKMSASASAIKRGLPQITSVLTLHRNTNFHFSDGTNLKSESMIKTSEFRTLEWILIWQSPRIQYNLSVTVNTLNRWLLIKVTSPYALCDTVPYRTINMKFYTQWTSPEIADKVV